MKYEKPEIWRADHAIEVIQSTIKSFPPTPDSLHRVTVSAYEADE